MAEYIAYLPIRDYIAVHVELPDDTDPYDVGDEVTEKAYQIISDEGPSLCYQCAGYGKKWSFDYYAGDLEISRIEKENGDLVWKDELHDL